MLHARGHMGKGETQTKTNERQWFCMGKAKMFILMMVRYDDKNDRWERNNFQPDAGVPIKYKHST